MALTQHITIPHTQKKHQSQRWQPSQLSTALGQRLLWHTKAYRTVFGIMLLTFASLGFLYIHWLGSRLLPAFKKGSAVNQEWETLQSK